MSSPAAWPSEILDHRASRALELVWSDGSRSRHSYHALRQACRCAECEAARRKLTIGKAIDPAVDLVSITPVSDTGLQLHFSDGHERGIFPWAYLRTLPGAPVQP